MKRYVSILLILVMLLVLTGCGAKSTRMFKKIKVDVKVGDKVDLKLDAKVEAGLEIKTGSVDDVKTDIKTDVKTDTKVDVKTDVKTDTKVDVKTDVKTDTKTDDKTDVKTDTKVKVNTGSKISSCELAGLMGSGFNLGNQFDAYDCSWLSNQMDYESAWSKAVTTREFIKSIHELGFTSIRIPVSWHNHVNSDLVIDKEWLNRVGEVVKWALEEDMYVIINTHHDIGNAYIYPSNAKYDSSSKYLVKIWTQLGEYFADYSDKLIFESMNEPRLVDDTYEWWVDESNPRCQEAIEVVNKLNQDFVNCIRKIPGNENRFLMVPSYCDMYQTLATERFKLPKDSADDKILVTFHAYLGYKFAGDENGHSDFTKADEEENEKSVSEVCRRFASMGVGVVVGEYGAIDKNNSKDRNNYFSYVTSLYKDAGFAYFVWDNNVFAPEIANSFGLVDRSSCKARLSAIIEIITRY